MKTITSIILTIAFLSGCRAVIVKPNEPEIFVIPASPGPGHIYINDSWRWNPRTDSYETFQGYWSKPKKSGIWIDGYWKKTRYGWKYVRGHWA